LWKIKGEIIKICITFKRPFCGFFLTIFQEKKEKLPFGKYVASKHYFCQFLSLYHYKLLELSFVLLIYLALSVANDGRQ
jgi:hypothetical protein